MKSAKLLLCTEKTPYLTDYVVHRDYARLPFGAAITPGLNVGCIPTPKASNVGTIEPKLHVAVS